LGASDFQVATSVGKSQKNFWIRLERVQSSKVQALDSFSSGFVEEGLSLQGSNHESPGIYYEIWLFVACGKDKQSFSSAQEALRDLKKVVLASTCDSALLRAIDIGESGFLP
jgi:hypothetical protein